MEADVLSEETKKELETAFQTKLDEATEAAKNETAADVRTELTEQWVQERDNLVEAIDSKINEFLETELDELKEDIERFRDLEAEYAEKLVEEKGRMSEELKTDLADLVEKLDAFLEIRLAEEIEELREDLDHVRQNDFGRKVYEAFKQEYDSNFADEESAEITLRETETRLQDVETALEESERARKELERSIKMEKVLKPLTGRQKEVMEAILRNVETSQLEEGFKTFIGRVIRETDSEKEDKVLAEGVDEKDEDEDKDKDDNDDDKDEKGKDKKKAKKDEKDEVKEGVVVTGDHDEVIVEEQDPASLQRIAYLKKLAGIDK